MTYQWLYSGCDTGDERAIAAHWGGLQPAWDARIEALDSPPDEATFAIVHNDGEAPEWIVQGTLVLPADVLSAEARGPRVTAALDELVKRLARRLDRLQDQPQESPQERPQRRRGLESIVPFLESSRRRGNLQSFVAFLRPLILSLSAYARRELAMHEIEGDIEEGAFELDELLDETLLLTWNHFEQRPRSLPLDAWVAGLIGQVLEEQTGNLHPGISLDEPATLESRRPLDDEYSSESWIEMPEQPEEIELADLLPGKPPPEAWERLDPDDREAGLNRLLSRLTREQRQSLLLSAVQGLETGEIAVIQGLSLGQAQAAIDDARASLSRLIEQEEIWPEVP